VCDSALCAMCEDALPPCHGDDGVFLSESLRAAIAAMWFHWLLPGLWQVVGFTRVHGQAHARGREGLQ
jgi:hypothetical protein